MKVEINYENLEQANEVFLAIQENLWRHYHAEGKGSMHREDKAYAALVVMVTGCYKIIDQKKGKENEP